MKAFSLSSNASEIANILDVEPDVSRYYAELVPAQLNPEEFWGRYVVYILYFFSVLFLFLHLATCRYFFRVLLITKGGVLGLEDDDEEEELVWESNEKSDGSGPIGKECGEGSEGESDKEGLSDADKINKLQSENSRLKSHIRILTSRVTELEKIVADRDQGRFCGLFIVE